ncbi:hypothetical protein ISCGN_025072 [Ixodes scapularis]
MGWINDLHKSKAIFGPNLSQSVDRVQAVHKTFKVNTRSLITLLQPCGLHRNYGTWNASPTGAFTVPLFAVPSFSPVIITNPSCCCPLHFWRRYGDGRGHYGRLFCCRSLSSSTVHEALAARSWDAATTATLAFARVFAETYTTNLQDCDTNQRDTPDPVM